MAHRRLASFVFAAASLFAPRVAAESSLGPNVKVAVEAAAECPTESEFVAAVGGALTPEVIASAPGARFAISFRREEQGTRGTLLVSSEDTPPLSRTVEASTCRKAAEALALVTLLIIDPLSVANPTFEEKKPPAAAPPPAPIPPFRAEKPVPPSPPPERPLRLGVAASLGAAAGITPAVAPTMEVRAIAALRSIPLEIHAGGGIVVPTYAHLAGGSVQFWGAHARAAACGVLRPARWTFGACAGPDVDWVFTNASNFLQVATTTAVIPSAVASGFGRYALGTSRFSVGLDAALGVVLVATSWNVVRGGEAHRTSALTGRLGALVEYEF
jgi:hypothetical protein